MGDVDRRRGINARRRYAAGTLPVPTRRIGRLIMVGEPVTGLRGEPGQTVVYARVSSADQQADLDRQVARVAVWATGRKLGVDRVVTEVGSALNGHRKTFLAAARPGRVDDRGRAPWSVRPLRRRVRRSRNRKRPGVKTVQAYRFALDLTSGQVRDVLAHAGAARVAHNWALVKVKAVLDWADSRTGRRAGRPVGFPRLKSSRTACTSCSRGWAG
nr:hypothetical protein GCM10020063_026080 [Dactylosporangium thailandense]